MPGEGERVRKRQKLRRGTVENLGSEKKISHRRAAKGEKRKG